MDILLATTNPGKLREFKALLADVPCTIHSPDSLGVHADVEETGTTFQANAEIKARAWTAATNMICVADDSGLCVDALDDAPGVYSARWAAKHGISSEDADTANLNLVLDQLADQPNRAARYVCVGVITHPDGSVQMARGEWSGTLIDTPRGTNGFGYDPIFVPDGFTQTVAELPAEVKNERSHRAKAMAALRDTLVAFLATQSAGNA